jgi:hypothetical protein
LRASLVGWGDFPNGEEDVEMGKMRSGAGAGGVCVYVSE